MGKGKRLREEKKEKAAQMSPETISVLTEITGAVSNKIDDLFENLFEKVGGVKIMAEANGKKEEDVKLADFQGEDMLQQAGADFRVIPTHKESSTNRPVAGKAMMFMVKTEMDFDWKEEIADFQIAALKKAHEDHPENEEIRSIYFRIKKAAESRREEVVKNAVKNVEKK